MRNIAKILALFAAGLIWLGDPALGQTSTTIEDTVYIFLSEASFSNVIKNGGMVISSNGILYSGRALALTNDATGVNFGSLTIQSTPVVTNPVAAAITSQNTQLWNEAYSWVSTVSNAAGQVAKTYINGYLVTVGTTSNLTVFPGQASCGACPQLLTSTNTLSCSINASGAGGLDSGTKAASTWYYVYVIAQTNGTNCAAILSTNSVAPTLPSGYIYRRLVAHARTGANTNLLRSVQYGTSNNRTTEYNEDRLTTLRVLTSGASTTFTSINLSGLVPAEAHVISGSAEFIAGATPAYLYLTLGSFTNFTAGLIAPNSGKSFTSSSQYSIHNENQLLYYRVTAANGSANIDVVGYDFEY